MSNNEKIGLGVLIGLFVLFGVILFVTLRTDETPTRGFSDNVLIEQRLQNIQKSR